MREENSNWFSKWEDQLPSPQDLTPLSQSLITPNLALAFNIPNPQTTLHHHHPPPPPPQSNSSAEFDSSELCAAAGGGADEPARTLKRPRLVWTPQLHKRFVDAVAHLGIKNAVPKTIMQLMSVDGLTRENVASHLQKYRLYLKRMQGISGNSGGGGGGISGVDAATDRLFGSTPVPAHFLYPGRANPEHFSPLVPVAGPMHQIGAGPMHQQLRRFGGSPPNGQFDHHQVLIRQSQVQGIEAGVRGNNGGDFEMASNGRKVLTLFPNGGD